MNKPQLQQQQVAEALGKMIDRILLQNAAWDVVEAFLTIRPVKLVQAILNLKKHLEPWKYYE